MEDPFAEAGTDLSMRGEELLSGGLTIELMTDSAKVFHLRPVENGID